MFRRRRRSPSRFTEGERSAYAPLAMEAPRDGLLLLGELDRGYQRKTVRRSNKSSSLGSLNTEKSERNRNACRNHHLCEMEWSQHKVRSPLVTGVWYIPPIKEMLTHKHACIRANVIIAKITEDIYGCRYCDILNIWPVEHGYSYGE